MQRYQLPLASALLPGTHSHVFILTESADTEVNAPRPQVRPAHPQSVNTHTQDTASLSARAAQQDMEVWNWSFFLRSFSQQR